MRLVLDTSVVISAVRNPLGTSFVLLELGLRREFVMLLSVPLMFEYEAVLLRPEQMAYSGLSAAQIDETLAAIIRSGKEILLGPYEGPESSDRGDKHVLSLALHGDADAIVSFNIRHFDSPARQLGVNLYMPIDALRALGK